MGDEPTRQQHRRCVPTLIYDRDRSLPERGIEHAFDRLQDRLFEFLGTLAKSRAGKMPNAESDLRVIMTQPLATTSV
jgi:hypothetical protein